MKAGQGPVRRGLQLLPRAGEARPGDPPRHLAAASLQHAAPRHRKGDPPVLRRQNGIGVICYSPLQMGMLTGTFTRDSGGIPGRGRPARQQLPFRRARPGPQPRAGGEAAPRRGPKRAQRRRARPCLGAEQARKSPRLSWAGGDRARQRPSREPRTGRSRRRILSEIARALAGEGSPRVEGRWMRPRLAFLLLATGFVLSCASSAPLAPGPGIAHVDRLAAGGHALRRRPGAGGRRPHLGLESHPFCPTAAGRAAVAGSPGSCTVGRREARDRVQRGLHGLQLRHPRPGHRLGGLPLPERLETAGRGDRSPRLRLDPRRRQFDGLVHHGFPTTTATGLPRAPAWYSSP